MNPRSRPQASGALSVRIRNYLAWQWGRARRAPGRLINHWFGNLWHDHWLRRKALLTPGLQSPASRVAVYVVYPRLGLQASHLASLAYLVRRGYAPLVVSNLPLTPVERERLQPLCWRLLERPNFGYDFGAYRDGVLMALNDAGVLRQLLLVNDSVWFPVPADTDWLEHAERLEVDMAGAVSNDGWVDYLADPSRCGRWIYNPAAPRLHYCSFALLMGPRILKDPGFGRFWSELKLTSDKFLTVRRGEVGLSRWVIERGYRHAATLDLTGFDQQLEQMDGGQLRALASHLIIPEDARLREEQVAVVGCSGEMADPAALRRFILRATAATGPAYALPYWSLPQQRFGFLKKSPLWLSEPTARLTEALIREHGDAAMLEEARQLAGGVRAKP